MDRLSRQPKLANKISGVHRDMLEHARELLLADNVVRHLNPRYLLVKDLGLKV